MFRAAKSLETDTELSYVVAGYTIFSPQLTYFASQYSKNLLGAIFLLWLIQTLISNKKHPKKYLILLLNLFIHKLTAGVSLIIFFLQIVINRVNKKHLILTVITGVFFLLIIWMIPEIFNVEDFHREGMGLTTMFSWPSYTFIQVFGNLIDIPWLVDVVICNVLFVTVIISLFWNANVREKCIPILIILAVLTFPFLQWSLTGFSFRALMVFLILCPLLISFLNISLGRLVTSILTILLIISGLLMNPSYNHKKHDPPYGIYRVIANKVNNLDEINIELIIAHRALAEYMTFKTGIDVLPWEPEYAVDRTKLWRICTGVNKRSIQYYSKDHTMKT